MQGIPRRRVGPVRALLGGVGAIVGVAGCSPDWDALDPRLATGSNGATTSGGQGGDGGQGGAGTQGGAGGEGVCGDGAIDVDREEECDDGNDLDGDGCERCVVACRGTGEVEDPVTHTCYLHGPDASWGDALLDCAAWGGHLAVIGTVTELAFIASVISVRTWIGGSDAAVEDDWTWVTDEPWFAGWSAGEPNDSNGAGVDEDCAELYQDVDGPLAMGFADGPCSNAQPVLCERPPPTGP